MPIDPSIPLQIRPVQAPDMLASAGRVMGLRNAMQQQQINAQQQEIGALQLQQAKLDAEDQQKARAAYMASGGDLQVFQQNLMKSGVSPKMVTQINQQMLTTRKTLADIGVKELEIKKSVTEALGSAAQATLQLPADARPMGWTQVRANLIQQGRIRPEDAPEQYPGDDAMQLNANAARTSQQIIQGILEERGVAARVKQADAAVTNAATSAGRLAAELPGIKARGQLAELDLTGERPVNKYQKEMLGQGAQRIAQGATGLNYEKERLGQGERRLSLEGQRVAREAAKKDISEQAIETAAQSIAGGDLTRLRDIASLRGDQRLLIFQRAKELNPKFNTAEIDRKIKATDYWVNGKGADAIQSFDTFLQHAAEAVEASGQSWRVNGKYWNKPISWWKQNMSADPAFASFVTSLEPVGKEFESFLLNGRALYSDDRIQIKKLMDENSPMSVIVATLKQMSKTAKDRYNSMNQRSRNSIGTDIPAPWSPEAVDAAGKLGVELRGAPQPSPTSSAIPQVGATFNGEMVKKVTRVK